MCCTTRFSVQFSTRTLEGCTVAWMELGVWVMYFRYCVPFFFLAVNCCCFNTWCLLPSVPPETQRCSSGAGARGSEHAWQMLALLPPQRAQGPRPQTYLLCRGNARDIYLHAPPVGPQAIGAAASDFPASPLASPAIGTFDSLRPAPRPSRQRYGGLALGGGSGGRRRRRRRRRQRRRWRRRRRRRRISAAAAACCSE